jgi:hypothetical protein
VPGKLVVIGAHMHELGRRSNCGMRRRRRCFWHGEPVSARAGQPAAVPATKFWGLRELGYASLPNIVLVA